MTLAKLEWKLFVDARILSLKNRLRKATIGIGIDIAANGKCSAQLKQNTMMLYLPLSRYTSWAQNKVINKKTY